MIGTWHTGFGKDLANESTESAFHAVAYDRAADLFRDCEADAHGRIVVRTRTDQQHETRHGHTLAGIGGKEFGAPH